MADLGRRYCDLVMKGGITSGVVFPKAIATLARQYEFCSIGGTSAGAIAAAGAAAAEYRRAMSEPSASDLSGFDRLAALPDLLAQKPDGKRSRLFGLFAPEDATRRHFALLAAALNRKTRMSAAFHCVVALLLHFPVAALLGAIPGVVLMAALDGSPGALRAFAFAFSVVLMPGGAFVAALVSATRSLLRAIPDQAYGLSRGYSAGAPGDDGSGPLVNFLYAFLQDVAGKPAEEPLTFGDLAGTAARRQRPCGIELKMMTTALTLGRPYAIPWRVQEFYFRKEELGLYFPPAVIAWMEQNPGERAPSNRARDARMKEFGYLPFPAQETLPVIVATRLSLSFPGLLSAVPLYRHAWEDRRSSQQADAAPPQGDQNLKGEVEAGADNEAAKARRGRFSEDHVQRVLFSDGGICSNFPVQLFDSVLPAWPTFGINLRDNLQRAAPGFRDRIVTVSHRPEEGGLNLDMTPEAVSNLAGSGELAAQELIAAFGTAPADTKDDYWTYHRWVRVRSLLCVLQQMLREIHDGVTSTGNVPVYPTLIDDAAHYVGSSYRLREQERISANETLEEMAKLHADLQADGVEFCEQAPRPRVELRIQPTV